MRRRELICIAGTLAVAGCTGTDGTSDSPAGTSPAGDDGATLPGYCDRTRVVDIRVEVRQTGTPRETAAPRDVDYVEVETEATEASYTIRGFVDLSGPEEVERFTRRIGGGDHTTEFGPFGHNRIEELDFWIEGCGEDTSTPLPD